MSNLLIILLTIFLCIFLVRSWFNTGITGCSKTKSKKASNNDDAWNLDGKSLFVMPNNPEFKKAVSGLETPPFVLMQPANDFKPGHDLIKGILEHRISAILLSLRVSSSLLPVDKLTVERDRLEHMFKNQSREMKRWEWPETSDKTHSSKMGDDKNRTAYSPSPSITITSEGGQQNLAVDIWTSFKVNLKNPAPTLSEESLLFRSSYFSKKVSSESTPLPRIQRVDTKVRPFYPFGKDGPSWEKAIANERAKKPLAY